MPDGEARRLSSLNDAIERHRPGASSYRAYGTTQTRLTPVLLTSKRR